jgi:CDP-glycerol glycerophosphotransferase
MGSAADRVRRRIMLLASHAASSRPRRRAEPEPPTEPPTEPPAEPPGEPLPEQPLLSVVVPVYQVEDYLAECLDSLLAQTYQHLEVVLVDDGSTDRSADIARGYAERDPRVVVVRQENAGLGAARNAGLARSTGHLVAFADSDDTVPPDAYRRMVAALRKSRSDFVVGALVRDEGGVERLRPWARRAHARRRLAVTIEDVPAMLTNVMACTKVFRREFVDRIGLRFPEGTRYEDQVPITRAYLEARAFDVLPSVVYRWRKRDDRSSISQQKAEMADLLDRVAAQREIAGFLHAQASQAVLRSWYVKTLREDFFGYLRVAADAGDDYWEVLQDNLVSIAEQAPEDLDDEVELRSRLAVWLGRHGHRDALRQLVRDEGFEASNFPVVARDGHLVARIPSLEHRGPAIPDPVLRIRKVDLRLTTRLESLDWSMRGVLTVRLLAALSFVDPGRHDVTTSVRLVGPPGTSYPDVATRVDADPAGNLAARRSHEDHSRSTVVAELDLEALVAATGPERFTRWELRVDAAFGQVHTEACLESRREHGSAGIVRAVEVGDALVTTSWSDRRGLLVEVHRAYAAVTGVVADDDAFQLDVRAPGLAAVSQVGVGGDAVPTTIVPTGTQDGWTIRLGARTLAGDPISGRVRVAVPTPDRRTLAVVRDLEPAAVCHDQVCLLVSRDGELTAVPDQPCLLVDDVVATAGWLTVTGRTHRVRDGRMLLRGPRAESGAGSVTVRDGTFRVQVPLWHTPWGRARTVLPANLYTLVAESDPGQEAVRVLAGLLYHQATPPPLAEGWSVEVAPDRRLLLRRRRRADPVTASRYGQQQLRSGVYARALARGPEQRVVFECFGGAGAGEAPRAVCDRLLTTGTDLDLVWSVEDLSVAHVEGTRAVVRGTPEWYDAMGSARLLVTNNTLPSFFRKGPDQVYLQTWHGTPLKRIGTDIPHQRMSTEHYLRLLGSETRSWDVLLSPSPYATEIFRRAFGYAGRVLEVGRPSSDVLLGPDAGRLRAEVREQLGVREDQTVLLYAPTWRDDARRGGTWEKVLHLDHEVVTAARPDVTVLVRGHPNTAHRPRVQGRERVVDVTAHPDITRLYLAADVLVTDYSSAMFDFAVTDKPMFFLTPDLEGYRDRVRGLYLDFGSVAAGPVVRSTGELLRALGEDDTWASAREELRRTFAPYDDGSVTDRLLQDVLGLTLSR